MEICEQEVYRGMFWKSAPVRGEGSKTGQKEKVNCDGMTTETPALPTGISGARVDLQHYLQERQGKQASVPGSDQDGEGAYLVGDSYLWSREERELPATHPGSSWETSALLRMCRLGTKGVWLVHHSIYSKDLNFNSALPYWPVRP